MTTGAEVGIGCGIGYLTLIVIFIVIAIIGWRFEVKNIKFIAVILLFVISTFGQDTQTVVSATGQDTQTVVSADVRDADISVTGTMISNNQRVAIVNGELRHLNDDVAGGRIISIDEKGITFLRNGVTNVDLHRLIRMERYI